ncbi:hypothetical protein KDK_04560 [Dictyobacter kobayashii]|uniref:Uncharacterized protein n=1 Tax=Dictyobacter kobayashii TaxID=2014872 RepID=A0A402AC36_9CHLR|nr:hypothetical protein KDK_04560 [Dictyobacter kobayashii]
MVVVVHHWVASLANMLLLLHINSSPIHNNSHINSSPSHMGNPMGRLAIRHSRWWADTYGIALSDLYGDGPNWFNKLCQLPY